MQADLITDEAIKAIESGEFGLCVLIIQMEICRAYWHILR